MRGTEHALEATTEFHKNKNLELNLERQVEIKSVDLEIKTDNFGFIGSRHCIVSKNCEKENRKKN